MPALAAIASVEAPSRPRAANSSSAASSTASRRSSADLGLDPLLAEGRDHLGCLVDLDHVGLPAVDVALVRRRRFDDLSQPLGVTGGDPSPSLEQLAKTGELRDPDGAENVGEPVVQA